MRFSALILAALLGTAVQSAYAVPVTFRDGVGGYTSTVDLFLGHPSTGHDNSNNATRQDLHSGGGSWHSMIRFDNVFGNGVGQVPLNSAGAPIQINSATLTFNARSTTTQQHDIYQLTVPFVETSTYNSLTGGITIGTETLATPTFSGSTAMTAGSPVSFNITSAVTNWANGAANNGLFFVEPGGGGSLFDSREVATILNRPLLTINWDFIPLAPEPGSIILWGAVASGGGLWWWRRRRAAA